MIAVSAGVFCLVYGFSNAATARLVRAVDVWLPRGWRGAARRASRSGRARAEHPLLPPRVVLDRNRGGAYLAILIVGAGMFGIFLFLTYYMQESLGYSPVVSGLAFLPMVVCIATRGERVQHRAAAADRPASRWSSGGCLLLAGGQVWLTRIGLHCGLRRRHPRPAHDHRRRHGPAVLHRDEHRHLRGAPAGRRRRLGVGQHRPAARRLDRHLAAEHDRGQRHGQLHRRHLCPRQAGQPGPGAGPGPRLHDGVLVVLGHLPWRGGHRAAR